MATNLLKDLDCKNASVESGKTLRKLSDGGGLYLWVYADGRKYWRFKYLLHSKEKLLSVGVYPIVTLAMARKKADTLRKQHAEGIDPSAARQDAARLKKQQAANTFEVVAREWLAKQVASWSDSHTLDVTRRLEANLFPSLGSVPIADITPPILLETVRKIEERGAHDLAHRVLGVASQVLRYGVATQRVTSDVSRDLRGALTAPVRRHQHAVTTKELPDLLRAIVSYDSPTVGGDTQTRLALQLLSLTFVRTTELIAATWDEVDLDAAMWCVPAERMKGGKELMVPLSLQSIAILKQLKAIAGDSHFVLPGRSGLTHISNNTILYALYRLGYRSRMTGHGFRTVASTYLNESGNYNADWIERQLAHVPANQVAGAYNRALYLPQRIQMMQDWSTYIDSVINDPALYAKKVAA